MHEQQEILKCGQGDLKTVDTLRENNPLDNKDDPSEYHPKEAPDKGQELITNVQGVAKAHNLNRPALPGMLCVMFLRVNQNHGTVKCLLMGKKSPLR